MTTRIYVPPAGFYRRPRPSTADLSLLIASSIGAMIFGFVLMAGTLSVGMLVQAAMKAIG